MSKTQFEFKQFAEGMHRCVIRSIDQAYATGQAPTVMALPFVCESFDTGHCIKVFMNVNLDTLALIREAEEVFVGRYVQVKVTHKENDDGTFLQRAELRWPRR